MISEEEKHFREWFSLIQVWFALWKYLCVPTGRELKKLFPSEVSHFGVYSRIRQRLVEA